MKLWGITLNHLYIPWRFVEGIACLPFILPTHKISPWSSQASPKNSKGKKEEENITKQNELGFPEMTAIFSPLRLYGGNWKMKLPLKPYTRTHYVKNWLW
jgi:hypothetical protein